MFYPLHSWKWFVSNISSNLSNNLLICPISSSKRRIIQYLNIFIERFEFSNIHLKIFWNFSKIEHVIYTYIFIINNFIYTKIWNILMRWVLYVGWMSSWIESGVIVLSKTSHDFQPQWKSLCDAFNLLLRDGMFHYWSPHSLFTYRNNLSTPLADVPLAGHVTKLTI